MNRPLPLILALAVSPLALGVAGGQEAAPSVEDARQSSEYWDIAQDSLRENARKRPIYGTAKNVIFFVGDGMGPTTVTAGRIYEGQRDGDDLPGVRNVLNFEALPHVALSKVYNTNVQVPDSAGTMTAMTTGVKTDVGVLNYLPGIERGDCATPDELKLTPLFGLAEAAGLSTGVISTARITHATPAATYAQVVDRNYENDTTLGLVPDAEDCADIAAQLVDFPYGDGIELAMGGGRRNFVLASQDDPEDEGRTGDRTDRDLVAEWEAKSDDHVVVFDQAGFDALGPDAKPLGLFERSHMEYELDREEDAGGEPSLAEMTEYAIDRLSGDRDGYVLVVEAGRIDHAHHGVNAARALGDTKAFDDAVEAALSKVDLRDTLVVVTADHGHVIGMQGYPTLDNDILGLVDEPAVFEEDDEDDTFPGFLEAADDKPYTTLSYLNGFSSPFFNAQGPVLRPNPLEASVEVTDKEYRQTALVPLGSETHGGQDVAIYAGGPKAYLFDGTVEQNYVYHVINASLDLDRKVDTARRLDDDRRGRRAPRRGR